MSTTSPARILVAEDNPQGAELLEAYVTGGGYDVRTAGDGESTLKIVREWKPDLILLDVILPKRSGFQVCRQLKQTPATKGIKIIMVTSKNQDSDRFWGLKQGADDYITKPFQPQELVDSVERHL